MNVTRLAPKLFNYITGKEYKRGDYSKYPELQDYFLPIILDYLINREKEFEAFGASFDNQKNKKDKKYEINNELDDFNRFLKECEIYSDNLKTELKHKNDDNLKNIKELVGFEQFILDFATITEKRLKKIEDELNIF